MLLRLATVSCVRKLCADLSPFGSCLRGSVWARSMADSAEPAAGAPGDREPVVKTEKQLKKEAQKNAKLAKYNEKMAKKAAQTAGEVASDAKCVVDP